MKILGRAGRFIQQQTGSAGFKAFVPANLPPDPQLDMGGGLQTKFHDAILALGKLDGVALMLPDPTLFLYTYVRKEAVLSSQIEGTQSSLSDLLQYENATAPGVPTHDVKEVSNYVDAMNHGLDRMAGGFPLSLRLIREMHERLLTDARGGTKDPGQFRRSQNWVGGTSPSNAVYVPPPVDALMPALDNLEKFMHASSEKVPPLIKAGYVHAQFETIHPFLDGNGRVGRLLITLLLCHEKVLQRPLLYLSLYFKVHRSEYYAALQSVRTDGDWEGWFAFFLDGIKAVSDQATNTSLFVLATFKRDREAILSGKQAAATARLHDLFERRALTSIPKAAAQLGLTQPTVTSAMRRLLDLGIVTEISGRKRDKQYAYASYLAALANELDVDAPPASTPPA